MSAEPCRGERMRTDMMTFGAWIALFFIVQAVLTAVQYFTARKPVKLPVRIVLILAKALIAIAFALLVMAGPVFLRPVQAVLTAIYAVLLPDAAADLLTLILYRKKRRFAHLRLASLILGAAFFVYGTVNMQIVTPNEHTLTSPKLTEAHRVVFVSDLHVGSSQSFDTTRRTIEKIGAEHPDLVILGGDITDDYTTKAEMEETYRLFGALGVPICCIDGNHEIVQHPEYTEIEYTYDELLEALAQNGITILRDELVEISPDLLLLGREDMADPSKRQSAAKPDPERFLLVADHQPTSIEEHLALGADLQLSGHTHAAQFFPLRLIYPLFTPTYGEYEYDGGAKLIVSAGASGWRFPFRTEAHCEYEVVDLLPVGN